MASAFSYQQLEALWINAGGSKASAPTAAAVALAESGGNPTIQNRQGANVWGLWQINIAPNANPEYSRAQVLDPLGNAKAAVAISGNGTNWNPWQTYTSGAYKAFLGSVKALSQTQILEKLGYTPAQITAKTAQGWDALSMRAANSAATQKGLPQPFTTAPGSAVIQDLLPLAAIAAAALLPAEAGGAGAAGAGAAGGGAGAATSGTLGSLEAVLAGGGIAALVAWVAANWLRILEFLGGAVLGVGGLLLLGKAAAKEV